MVERDDAGSRLAVVIPAYRAGRTVSGVIRGVRAAVPAAPIYVVDDGSDDDTAAAARGTGAAVASFPENRGKGAALAAGVSKALSLGADVIVTLDADGQHEPSAVPSLAGPVIRDEADLVLGARQRTARMPAPRRFNNWVSSRLASRLAGYDVPDAQTGFRAFHREVAEHIRPMDSRYDFELEFLLGALEAGFRVRSVPVATIYDRAASHFRLLGDTWRVARVFARHSAGILRGKR
jgi:glycosyltransferase involved in cell wall biosynthesis